ncbi:hypothetical protein CDO73_25970 [Saccharibacillus sp. O23]|uniref:alpha/beta hydrolase n=1 Tax=Saccharibacillus sp. O23 TaxID=2009338 RepID=UPI000B4E81DC|nr:hypothetical protein [Saccharibacillus sp. O23]OWR26543.1 hypothetical protein CDO73_25970 [Saccharibacillus sp. O23]
MENMTATRLLNEALRIREEQGAEAAYRFVRQYSIPDETKGSGPEGSLAEKEAAAPAAGDARQANLLYALAAASGRESEAMAVLREAVLEQGFWYPADYLLEDEDLEPLRGMDGFAELADLCAKREEAALANAAPGLAVLGTGGSVGGAFGRPADEVEAAKAESAAAKAGTEESAAEAAARPLLLALHGDQENERDSAPFWGTASRAGWTVGLVRSSQTRFSDAYGWDDIDLGAAELREHLETLRGSAPEPGGAPVALGAYSAGAEVALNALLHDELPADGLVLVSPWLDEPGEWVEAMDRLEGRTPRFALIAGAEDAEGREAMESLVEAMQEAGLEFRLELVPGMGHDYPADFAARLDAALAWIAEGR